MKGCGFSHTKGNGYGVTAIGFTQEHSRQMRMRCEHIKRECNWNLRLCSFCHGLLFGLINRNRNSRVQNERLRLARNSFHGEGAVMKRATHQSMCSTCARHQPHVGAGRADIFWLGTREQRKRSGVVLFLVPWFRSTRRQDSSMIQRRKR